MLAYWSKLSFRERVMFGVTSALILGAIVWFVARQAVGRIENLDEQVQSLQQELLTKKQYEARSDSIRRAYAEVAAEHSSKWTEAEIHDRLRREIYRLARLVPTAPAGSSATGDYLVKIPTLREGTLDETGKGYREYHITIQIPSAPLRNVFIFLQRLQESRQTLRVDRFELARAHDTDIVGATIEVTRTVVDGVGDIEIKEEWLATDGVIQNASFETWDSEGGAFQGWETENCTVEQSDQFVTRDSSSMKVVSESAGAVVYQTVSLGAGRSYELQADITTSGAVTLGVMDDSSQTAYPGALEIAPKDEPARYGVRFDLPGKLDAPVTLRLPYLVIPGNKTTMYIDNVQVTEVDGS